MTDIDQTATSKIQDFVPLFKAFCNETRAQIVEFLLAGERCVCEMTGPLDVSQPLVSHHLSLLRQSGLITRRDEGTRTYYAIDRERFDALLSGFLAHVEHLRDLPEQAEVTRSACALAAELVGSEDYPTTTSHGP